jgi:hypothetical protein
MRSLSRRRHPKLATTVRQPSQCLVYQSCGRTYSHGVSGASAFVRSGSLDAQINPYCTSPPRMTHLAIRSKCTSSSRAVLRPELVHDSCVKPRNCCPLANQRARVTTSKRLWKSTCLMPSVPPEVSKCTIVGIWHRSSKIRRFSLRQYATANSRNHCDHSSPLPRLAESIPACLHICVESFRMYQTHR